MLRTDAAKLRWMGIDLRERWRRRVAVVLTYVALLVLVWFHPRLMEDLVWLCFMFGSLQMFTESLGKELSLLARRAITVVLFSICVLTLLLHPHRFDPLSGDILAFACLACYSVLGMGKLVDGVWRRGPLIRRLMARPRRLEKLDDYADHLFGERFADLSEAQQVEVGQFQRESPLGAWVKRGSGRFPLMEDERLIHEDDRLRARVQRVLTLVLIVSAVAWSLLVASRHALGVVGIAAWAWTMAALAMTLRQAIVLWTEESPERSVGEMRSVDSGTAMTGREV